MCRSAYHRPTFIPRRGHPVITRRGISLGGSVALLGVPGIAFPQSTGKLYRVGVLGLSASSSQEPIWDAFVAELARRGHVEGRNLAFERRFASRDAKDLDSLAAELVALNVDLVFTSGGTSAAQAAKKATTTIPIVMLGSAEPVRDGLVNSLAHPGGNITGNSAIGLELQVKRLQLIAEAVGKPNRIAYLGFRRTASMLHFDEYQAAHAAAARSVGAELRAVTVDSIDDLDSAFEIMVRQRVDALVIENFIIFYVNVERIVGLVARYRMPAIAEGRAFADAGLLMTYGLDYIDLARRAAGYVDRILRGANPGDLPVEQASKFEMVVNLKTAKALGISVPRALLLRADEVIA